MDTTLDDIKNGFVDDPLQPDSDELLELQERSASDDHVQAVEPFIVQTEIRSPSKWATAAKNRRRGPDPSRP